MKDYVILGAPPATDVRRLMQVRAPFTPLFVLPRAAAGTATQLGANIMAELKLSGAINALPAERRAAEFKARLATFFSSIGVLDDQATVDAAARDLPTKERYDPPKMDEPTARRLHPELFKLPP